MRQGNRVVDMQELNRVSSFRSEDFGSGSDCGVWCFVALDFVHLADSCGTVDDGNNSCHCLLLIN